MIKSAISTIILFILRELSFRHLYLVVGSWLLAAGFVSCGNSNRTTEENSTKPDVDSMQTTCYSDVVEKKETLATPVDGKKVNLIEQNETTIMITCYDVVAPIDSLQ